MAIARVQFSNFTVFENLSLDFDSGISVFIGENGVGKTHIMKVLYAACCASNPSISFSQKLVRCFLPDDYRISRLLSRRQGSNSASIKISSDKNKNNNSRIINMQFHSKTKKWDADVTGEEGWEKQMDTLSSIFIPAKEILSNANNLNAAVEKNNVTFDDTYLDLLNSARVDISVGNDSQSKSKRLKRIETITGGKVTYDEKRDEFYLRGGNARLEFPLLAEGTRKIALLWQLIKNGTLEKGSVLFWDEPEANLNPAYLPIIVDLLLDLQREGVQIFISTHDYFLAKYFDVRKKSNEVKYYSFFRNDDGLMKCEASNSFVDLKNNAIMDTFMKLYHEEVRKAIE